jgi:hypothetical protein
MACPQRISVGHRRGNTQSQLRAGARCTPDPKLTAHLLGALSHPAQSKMTRKRRLTYEFGLYSFAVVPDAKLKSPPPVVELHLYATRLRVPVGISQGFARSKVYLLANGGLQRLQSTFNVQGQRYGGVGWISRQRLTERPDSFGEVTGFDGG